MHNAEAVENIEDKANSVVILCVKPQRIKGVLNDLKDVVSADQLIISIVAGARIENISQVLGSEKSRSDNAKHAFADRAWNYSLDMH